MMNLNALKIDPEFQGKIPPLNFEEEQQLEQNILHEGRLLNPIIIWNGERRPMNAICDTTAKSETISVKGCKVKITYAPADTDCLDAIQKLLQTTILRTAGHTAA